MIKKIKENYEIKSILKKQSITLLWIVLYFFSLWLSFYHKYDYSYEKEKLLDKNLIYFSAIGMLSMLFLNSKFKELNMKNFFIKISVSLAIASIAYAIGAQMIPNSGSILYHLAIIGILVLIYYYSELENGKTMKELMWKTLDYMCYIVLSFTVLTILIAALYGLVLTQYYIPGFVYMYLYSLVGIVYFILFQEDEKDYVTHYEVIEKGILKNIFKIFFTLLILIMYVSIFLYGRAEFYAITYFIFFTGYIILVLSIIFKNKKLVLVMLPLNIFLIFKISERIKILGLTEGRYFILVFGIVLLVMNIIQYFKQDNEKKYVLFIIGTIVLTVFVPKINAFEMSRKNLTIRANKLVEQLDKKIKSNEKILYEDIKEINDYFYYFNERNYKADFMDFVNKNSELISMEAYYYSNEEEGKRFILDYEYGDSKLSTKGLDISGYKKIYDINLYSYSDEESQGLKYNYFEKIYQEQKRELEIGNQKIYVRSANILFDEEKNKYFGELNLIILEK